MKNLYPKGKGRIHPSPGSSVGALAVLRLLPAAILALTAALRDDDKEVLAYLITRSINGPAAALAGGDDRRRRRRCGPLGGGAAAVHRPMFDCGCFECYTSFWSRWDCSPDREVISQAIDAFEEQLSSAERGGARARRWERRAAEKGRNPRMAEEKASEAEEKAVTPVSVSESCSAAEEEKAGEEEATAEEAVSFEEVSGSGVEAVAVAVEQAERRRGWPDVMGLLNCRLWSLWSPGA